MELELTFRCWELPPAYLTTQLPGWLTNYLANFMQEGPSGEVRMSSASQTVYRCIPVLVLRTAAATQNILDQTVDLICCCCLQVCNFGFSALNFSSGQLRIFPLRLSELSDSLYLRYYIQYLCKWRPGMWTGCLKFNTLLPTASHCNAILPSSIAVVFRTRNTNENGALTPRNLQNLFSLKGRQRHSLVHSLHVCPFYPRQRVCLLLQ